MTPQLAYADPQNFEVVNKTVSAAKELGDLPSSAIWALFCLVLVAYVWYTAKSNRQTDLQWQGIRLKDAEADAAMAQAVGKMADEISHLKVIVDERIPRGGPHA